MVERRVCTFCGVEIEPGTGRMYVRKDGVTYNFCSSKCFKNLVELGRVPRRVTWTRHYEREKQIRMKPGLAEAAPKKVRKVKKEDSEEKEAPAGPAPDAGKEADAPAEAAPEKEPEAPAKAKPAAKKAKPAKDEGA
ncbi:MAG: 50S ribosomal protein L24e [Candidatus Thermoplasmatota archaeon]